MPGWLTEIVKLLGFTTPLLYAAATYGFFLWLDKKASGPAKKAISGWLVPKQYDRAGVAAAILEMFDRVYTRPLFGPQAFIRSALITIVIVGIVSFEFSRSDIVAQDRFYYGTALKVGAYVIVFATISVNILSDYLSLFIVRRQLASERITPIKALLLVPLIGILVVAVVIILGDIVHIIISSIISSISRTIDGTWSG